MRSSVQRLIAATLILGLLAPSVSALGVGLHVHSAHGHEPSEAQKAELSEILAAAVHGHHHSLESEQDHDHFVRLDGAGQARIVGPEEVAVVAREAEPSRELARTALSPIHRRGPPQPLFEVNCALLI